MPYFDPAADVLLLHESIRLHDELHEVAEEAEAEVIDEFTQRGRSFSSFALAGAAADGLFHTFQEGLLYYTVFLVGYAPDPVNADGYAADRSDWTGLADALRRTIAKVVSHRLRHYEDNDMASESIDGYSYDRRDMHDARWPRGWRRLLSQYDHSAPATA